MSTTELCKTARAVLDEAHIGDIRGALGTIRHGGIAPRRGWWPRLRTLLAILGPGLIVNRQPLGAVEFETHYAVELRCQGQQEAHIRALLLQAASAAGLGLRRLTSENLEDSPQVTVSALLVSGSRNDAALEQIIGRMSLEPYVTAAHWQAGQAAADS